MMKFTGAMIESFWGKDMTTIKTRAERIRFLIINIKNIKFFINV